MDNNKLKIWFSVVSFILILFGILHCIAGLKILPVNREVLLDWESDLYGVIMIWLGNDPFSGRQNRIPEIRQRITKRHYFMELFFG
jgi:hypothetical protein